MILDSKTDTMVIRHHPYFGGVPSCVEGTQEWKITVQSDADENRGVLGQARNEGL